jgi:hypothetical protein
MRLTAIVGALLLSGCAGTQTDSSQPLARACSVAECFLERDVRDFEVLDPTTVVVYVGQQRCAFKVQLVGAFCDLTFAPEIFFRSNSELETASDRDVFGRSGQGLNGARSDLRVCSGDLKIGVDGGPFSENPSLTRTPGTPTPTQPTSAARDRFGNERSQCRLSSVSSLTDDQVLELYVAHDKVAPPPPMGAGQIEVGDQKDGESAGPSPGGASPGPAAPPPASAPAGG